ncbi:MAG: hypothetical protein IJA66_04580 [Alistipes sp.]|nr:hypothetical protein [Alistipes sp.]
MRRLFTNLFACATMALALVATSCTTDPEDKLPVPNFPATVNENVTAGEIYTLSIEPNQAWTISIPEESTYFTILDNDNEVYSVSGNKGSYQISIKVADIRDYNESHSCDVTMKMGKTEQVIATITLGKLTRSIEIYDVKIENGEWVYGESDEAQFEYATEQVSTDGITLTWGENGLSMFSHRVKVVSNFDWKIDGAPEWIQAIPNSTDDVTELWIKGDPANYPDEASTATLSFLDANDSSVAAVATLKVSIAEVTSVFSLNDFDESYKFNYKGEVYSTFSSSYYEGNAEGSVTFINEAIRIYTLSFDHMSGLIFPTFGHDWVTSTISEWDDKDTDKIQTRSISIGVTANNDAEREAIVLAIPQSVVDTFDDANEPYEVLEMAENGMGASGNLIEAYQKYVVTTVKQEAHPGPIRLTNASELPTIQMLKVSTTGDSDVAYDFRDAQHGYELLYTSQYDSDDAIFQFDGEYTSIEYCYYSASGGMVSMSESDSWVEVNPFGSAGGFRLVMNPSATTNKHWKDELYYKGAYWSYVVFKNNADIVAVISCLYNEGYSLTGESGSGSAGVSFSYPYAISIDGSSLVELTSGEIYESVVGNYGEIPVWHLTFITTSATMSALAGIDTSWSFFYLVESDKEWLSFEPGEMATVSMKSEGNGKTGIIIFTDANNVPKMALACSLNIAQ